MFYIYGSDDQTQNLLFSNIYLKIGYNSTKIDRQFYVSNTALVLFEHITIESASVSETQTLVEYNGRAGNSNGTFKTDGMIVTNLTIIDIGFRFDYVSQVSLQNIIFSNVTLDNANAFMKFFCRYSYGCNIDVTNIRYGLDDTDSDYDADIFNSIDIFAYFFIRDDYNTMSLYYPRVYLSNISINNVEIFEDIFDLYFYFDPIENMLTVIDNFAVNNILLQKSFAQLTDMSGTMKICNIAMNRLDFNNSNGIVFDIWGYYNYRSNFTLTMIDVSIKFTQNSGNTNIGALFLGGNMMASEFSNIYIESTQAWSLVFENLFKIMAFDPSYVKIDNVQASNITVASSVVDINNGSSISISNVSIDDILFSGAYSLLSLHFGCTDAYDGNINVMNVSNIELHGILHHAMIEQLGYENIIDYLIYIEFNSTATELHASFTDITFKSMIFNQQAISIVVLNTLNLSSSPMQFKNVVLENLRGNSSDLYDNSLISYVSTVTDNIFTPAIEFIDCIFRNNINTTIVSCDSGVDTCKILFFNCLFDNNSYVFENQTLYNVFEIVQSDMDIIGYNISSNDSSSTANTATITNEIIIFDSIFVGDYDSQVGGINASFIFDSSIFSSSNITCIGCTFYNTLPPTFAPSNVPTSPTSAPTVIPTASPTNAPTITPSHSPTHSPTNEPTIEPTATPTTQPSLNPINSDIDGVMFVSNNDIEFRSLDALSVNNDNKTFNPGFRNTFGSQINIKLQGESVVELFENYYNFKHSYNSIGKQYSSNNINLTISVIWKVIDENTDTVLDFSEDSQEISVTQYDTELFNTSTNKTYGTYTINSYYVLYSSHTASIYSNSICNIFNEEYFESGQNYTFKNSIELTLSYKNEISDTIELNVEQEESVTLSANTPPMGGTCIVTPETGVPLFDKFNITCSGWTDGSDSTGIKYNFIYDNFLFLKGLYDIIPTVSTMAGAGSHTITVVILDEFSLATCYNVNVTAQYANGSEFLWDIDTTSVENVTTRLIDTLHDLVSETTTSAANKIKNNTNSSTNVNSTIITEISLIVDIIYDLVLEYSETDAIQILTTIPNNTTNKNTTSNANINVNQELAELQEDIIEIYIENVEEEIETVQEAEIVLTVLTKITEPIINTDIPASNEKAGIYNSTVVSSTLDIVSDPIIAMLQDSVISGELDNVDSNTAQNVFYVFDNLIRMRKHSTEDENEGKANGQSTIDLSTTITQLVVASFIPSESIVFTTESMVVQASKIALDMDYNSYTYDQIRLSDEYIQIKSDNGNENMDCTVMITNDNLHSLSLESLNSNDSESFYTNFILLDITPETQSASRADSSNSVANSHNATNIASTVSQPIMLSQSDPIVVAFNVSNASYFDDIGGSCAMYGNSDGNETKTLNHIPLCSFYNETSQKYSDNGCYLLDYDFFAAQCVCLHATYYGVRSEQFKPQINIVDESEWEKITIGNIFANPLGLIVVLTWSLLCILFIVMAQWHHKKKKIKIPYISRIFDHWESINDKPLVAESRQNIEKILSDNNEKLKYRSIQEIRVIKDDMLKNRHFFMKFYHLYKVC